MRLVKTLDLPDGRGQHFFLDMGNGVDGIAFFWFPSAPEGVRGESIQGRGGISAIGSMNHVAFDVAPEKFDEYAAKEEFRLRTIRYYTALLNAKAGRTNEATTELQALNKEMAQDGSTGSLRQAVLATLKQLRAR